MSDADKVGVDKLEESLKALVKAAEETSGGALAKGGVDNSGFADEDGTKGGGQGSWSDVGGLDSMMIGKMKDAGVPAAILESFAAFMKKQDDDDEEDDLDLEYSEKSAKSSLDLFKSDTAIEEMMDVSPYLDSFTVKTAEQFDAINKSLRKGQAEQSQVNRALVTAVHQLGTLAKSQSNVINELGKRLGVVEHAPVAQPKAVFTKAQAMQKSMPGEAGTGTQQLRKSEVCATLTYMNLEKGIKHIGGRGTGDLAILAEAGNVIDDQTLSAVHDFLRKNPNEAELAKSYQ